MPDQTNQQYTPAADTYANRVEKVKQRVKELGGAKYNLILPETRALADVLHPNETILGIVYGRYKQNNGTLIGRGALVSTNKRVFLLDKKPMFIRNDEIIYEAISGAIYSHVGFMGTVTLHTKIGDIKVRTFNQKLAELFVKAIESNKLNRQAP